MVIENRIGTIKLNDTLFAKAIYNAISLTNDELFMSSENCNIIATKNRKGKTNNLASNIVIETNGNNIDIQFFVIMKFGTSVSENAEKVLNDIIYTLSNGIKEYNIYLHMKVVGIKSKKIANRNLDFTKSYEFK